jgi:hypothetical protein
MNVPHTKRRHSSEAGVAMLIAIFVLLLIAVVGITLILSSGTETALAGNYRSSTVVYYAALAGLEEGRGRLMPKNANYFNVFPGPPGTPLPVGQVWYITNPTNGGNVLTDYPDKEFDKEFAGTVTLAGSTVTTVSSVSPVAGIQGPLYRWVRINAVTEKSLKLDINNDGDQTDPGVIYYDGSHLTLNPTGAQALEITSLAVLPNGTQKMAQYIVAPATLNLNFPGALILDGDGVHGPTFGPGTTTFQANGNDETVGTCAAGPPVTAIGYIGADHSQITATPSGNYIGPGGTPSVNPVTLASNLQSVSGLNALVATISKNADVTITPLSGTAYASDMPTNMSVSNPLTVVVNGDLDLNGWFSTGYGILLVTGNLIYDPGASWEGIVLVIGKGTITSKYNGSGGFDGAVFLATTVDASNNPLTSLGTPSFTFVTGDGGNGIRYSSCWIRAVQAPSTYKVLSFHEILQQ